MRENAYQRRIVVRLKETFPGCVVLKNDSDYAQGIPDLLVLFESRWAMLEVKASAESRTQPNQRWWIDELDNMSFAAFIFPENEDEVMHDLQRALTAGRASRVSKRK